MPTRSSAARWRRSLPRRRRAVVRPPATSSPRPPNDRRRLGPLLKESVPIALSVLSFLLALFAIVQANRDPEVQLSLPAIIRLAQGGNGIWLYLQPRLETPNGAPVPLVWDEQGTWRYDLVNQAQNWEYVANPAPLAVGPASPQLPICLFVGSPATTWDNGTYRALVEATQTTADEQLSASLAFTIDAANAEWLSANPGKRLDLRVDQS